MKLQQVRSFRGLRYPGGKSYRFALETILNLAPAEIRDFREPFCGGASVALTIRSLWPEVPVWINDCNEGVVAVYKGLQKRYAEIEKQLLSIPFSSYAECRTAFENFQYDDSADPAVRWIILSRLANNGTVNLRRPKTMQMSERCKHPKLDIDRWRLMSELLQGVKITCGDYRKVMDTRTKGAWIYLDPPYIRESEVSEAGRFYERSFGWEDHREFAEEVLFNSDKHDLLVSYGDHPMVWEELFDPEDGFQFRTAKWPYRGGFSKLGGRKKRGRELLISNYTPGPTRFAQAPSAPAAKRAEP